MQQLLREGGKGVALALCTLGTLAATAPLVRAQDTVSSPSAFPDVPANHWAYAAVTDLANKGYVKGYPNSTFLGNRALTRYEFATVIDRILQTVDEIKNAPAAPATPQVTQDDLNKIQVLVDTFKQQLGDIQTNLTKAQADIEELRGQIADLRQDVLDTKDLATKAQATADASYGVGSKRKFQISGYIQARYYNVDKGSQSEFPDGTSAANGPYNGNFAKGGAGATFNLRRSRIKFTGALTKNSKYAIQIDAAGGGNAVTAREGNVTYTLGDGSARNVALTAGLFANPFGYELPTSSSSILSPERPLAFSETGNGGPFNGQDYDRGVMANLQSGYIKYTAAFVNGTGLATGTDTDRKIDQIYRAAYQTGNKVFGLSASYYNGTVTKAGAAPAAHGKKELIGVDAQYISPAGPFLQGEYLEGKFPVRNYFTDAKPNGATSDFKDGNKVRGYYVQGGWTWGSKGAHPLTAAASWDVFDRSYKGVADSGSSYRDENLGYGVLYNLDSATRLRLWYVKPNKVAHLAGNADPDKVGMLTSELQVKF